MDSHQTLEEFKRFIIENAFPQTDMALFGTRCPYCGKSDRIRPLEKPGELPPDLAEEIQLRYSELWRLMAAEDQQLGVCKFCQNPLRLGGNGQAAPLYGEMG